MFSLVVSSDGHGKAECDYKTRERQSCGQHRVQVFPLVFLDRPQAAAEKNARLCRQPEQRKRQNENKKWVVS
jgi:hypothetical protein